MPTSSPRTVPLFRVFGPLLALAFASCSYHYDCRGDDHEHGGAPHQQGPAQPMHGQAMPMMAMDAGPQQQRMRPAEPERDHGQRDEERATNERVHREIHERLDRISERVTRLERMLEEALRSTPRR